MAAASRPPLWTCPRCGHRFVTRNLWHSCGRYKLADHFKLKDPIVPKLFNQFRAVARECGPVTVYAQKTRIVFQGRVRFGVAVTRKRWLDAGLWLTRRAKHPTLRRIEHIAPRCYVHSFRLQKLQDLDNAFAKLVWEAYAVGQQEHLSRP